MMDSRTAEVKQHILDKCEQYWNEPGIPIPEIHAILEFIHREVILLSNLVDTQLREREEALYMAKEALDTIPERPSPDRYGSDAVIHLYHESPFWELKRKALTHPAMRAGEK